MGFLQFAGFFSPRSSKVTKADVTIDFTTRYPPRKARNIVTINNKKSVNIPMELVYNILEAAYHDEKFEPDTHLLKNCSLVCKDWSSPAQKLLFRHITLRTESAFKAFKIAVDRRTERGKGLGNAVLRLRVTLDHNQPYGLTQSSFARAVLLCPNLYELNLSLYGRGASGIDVTGSPDMLRMSRPAPSFDARTLDILRSGPQISSLQFSNWSENGYATLQLLDVWPSLTVLALQGIPPPPPSASALDVPPLPCALREFRMNFQTVPSLDLVRWLLYNSTASLRMLELAREPSAALLDYLVDTHGAMLESLSIPACGSRDHAMAVRRCVSLREFRIESPWLAPSVLKKLPSTLEHVAFGVNENTPLPALIDAINGRKDLRAVTVHLWIGGEQLAAIPKLKMICAKKGIELVITVDVQRFRVMNRGDPVPCISFPRSKTLANFRTMFSLAKAMSTGHRCTHDHGHHPETIISPSDNTDSELSPSQRYDSSK